MPITEQHTQEELSKSYVAAVAAKAGVKCSWETMDYGIDGRLIKINVIGGRHVQCAFGLSVQLKASKNWEMSDDGKDIIYDLEAKTYNDLAQNDPDGEGAMLILMCLPKDKAEWLEVTHNQLLMRNSCYWWKQTGSPTSNKSSVRIRIPRHNLLDTDAIKSVLDFEKSRRKGEFK